jgi:hypothetical protein
MTCSASGAGSPIPWRSSSGTKTASAPHPVAGAHVLRQFVERDDLIRQIAEDAGRAFELAAGAGAWSVAEEIVSDSLAVNDPRDSASREDRRLAGVTPQDESLGRLVRDWGHSLMLPELGDRDVKLEPVTIDPRERGDPLVKRALDEALVFQDRVGEVGHMAFIGPPAPLLGSRTALKERDLRRRGGRGPRS